MTLRNYIYNKVMHTALTAVVATLLFCACSHDKDESDSRLIEFRSSIDGVSSRGAMSTPDNSSNPIRQMSVMAHISTGAGDNKCVPPYFFHNLEVTRGSKSSPWQYSPAYYWPGVVNESRPVLFLAYSPKASGNNGVVLSDEESEPELTYTMPSSVESQPDLLATEPVSAYNENSPVNLPFNHILSAVRLVVGSTSDSSSPMIAGLTITKVELVGIKTKGSFSFTFTENGGGNPRAVWTLDDTSTANCSYSFNYVSAADDEPGFDIMGGGNCFMVLPQAFSSSSEAELRLTCSYNGTALAAEKSVIKLDGRQWEAGKVYSYAITFHGQGIRFEVTENWLKNWAEGASEYHGAYNW